MKKFTALLLVVVSLFTLSSSLLCYGAPIGTEPTALESLNDNNAISFKEKKIKKFFSEKGQYFPTDKLLEINSLLHTLKNDELELVLIVNFKNPRYVNLIASIGGAFGADDRELGSNFTGLLRLLLGYITGCSVVALKSFSDPNHGRKYEKATQYTSFGLCVLVPTTIVSWIINISTASDRAKEYNYQLLLKTLGKQS